MIMSKIKFQENIQNIQVEMRALYAEVNPSSTSIQLDNIAYFAQGVIANSRRQNNSQAQTKYDACQRILRLYDLHVKMLAIAKKIENSSQGESSLSENTQEQLYEKLTELCNFVLNERKDEDKIIERQGHLLAAPYRYQERILPKKSVDFISKKTREMHEIIRTDANSQETPKQKRVHKLKAFAKGEVHPLVSIPTLLFAAAIGVVSAFGGAPVGIAFFACMGILVHLGTLAGTYSYYLYKSEKHKALHDVLDAGEKAITNAAYGANTRRVPVQAEDDVSPQYQRVNAHDLAPTHPNPIAARRDSASPPVVNPAQDQYASQERDFSPHK